MIAPTAALSAMPYAPEESLDALRCFYEDLGPDIYRPHGFADAFNASRGWVANSHLAVDQGPIVAMIENHRSALLWRLFMSCPEIRVALRRLDFESPWLTPGLALARRPRAQMRGAEEGGIAPGQIAGRGRGAAGGVDLLGHRAVFGNEWPHPRHEGVASPPQRGPDPRPEPAPVDSKARRRPAS